MTVWAEPPLSRREARRKGRQESGETDVVSDASSEEELAAAAAAEEAARFGGDPVVWSNRSGGRRAQWTPPVTPSSFAPVQEAAEPVKITAHEGSGTPTPDNSGESQEEVAPELTMTRRELRALRERAEAAANASPEIVFLPTPEAEPTPAAPQKTSPKFAEPPHAEPGEAEPGEAEPTYVSTTNFALADPIPELINPESADWKFRNSHLRPEPAPSPGSSAKNAPAEAPTSSVSGEDEPEYIEAEIVEESDSAADSERHASVPREDDRSPSIISDRGTEDEDVSAARPESLRPFDSLFRSAPPATEGPEAAAEAITGAELPAKPYGHWTTQAELDDAAPSVDGLLSRDVGVTTGAITTHALVLPSIPEAGDQLLAALTPTGEIILTGSVDLPRTFGSTGAHPARFDHPDMDALIDDSDREDADAMSAPVRAIRAVSSTGSSRGVIEAPARPRSRLPLIIGITVGGLILVAGAFVAAAIIFKVI